MKIEPPEYSKLSLILAGGHYCGIDLVSEAISELNNVISGKIASFMFASEYVTIEAKQEVTQITINYDDYQIFDLPTSEILTLMQDWLHFLNCYYNNDIPGLPYPPPPIDWFKNKRL
jgi:hypothetical protein